MTDTQQPKPEPSLQPLGQDPSAVARLCEDLTSRLRMDLTVRAVETGGTVTVNLCGPDRAMLLSNTAALLNSIEYLVNKIFRTGKDARITSITLDSDNYRQHRQAELTLLAEMAAKKVLAQGKPLTLQPMTPRERRIVHLALAEISGVRSQSDGEGDNRSITIHPS